MVHAHKHHDRGVLQERSPDNGQAVTVVYVTAPADFDGPIGGYMTGEKPSATKPTAGVGGAVRQTRRPSTDSDEQTTKAESDTKTQEAVVRPTAAKDTTIEATSEATSEVTSEPTKAQQTQQQPTQTEQPTQVQVSSTEQENKENTATAARTTFSTATSSTSSTSSLSNSSLEDAAATNTSSSNQSSASASAIPSNSEGLTGGAKAGIAIGVILGVGLIAGLIFFFLRKKKKKQGEKLAETGAENEKAFAANDVVPPGPPPKPQPMTPTNPPQLNVRPVTQFAPDLTPSASLAALGDDSLAPAAAAAAPRNLTGNSSPTHTPKSSGGGSDPFGDPVNPFSNHADPSSPVSAVHSVSPSTAPAPASGPGAAVASGAGAATAAGAAAAAAATHESANKDLPNRPGSSTSQAHSVPGSSTASPVNAPGADTASVASSAGAAVPVVVPTGAGPAPGPGNVHRVQMDFAPSMEDELELHAGQLVRLLHEYDDGWALCVRLDRSQQGVAPRSCLSSRPVKPRAGPPPGQRGPPMMGPNSPMPKPQRFYPQESRPGSPANSMSPAGRPMSPAQSMSPVYPASAGPQAPRPYQQRPMSPAQFPAVPRSYSPGPGPRPMPRSMSPGPYGPPGMQRPEMPATQRQRSNSASGPAGPHPRMAGPPGPSPLAAPNNPPPTGALPAIPNPAPVSQPGPDSHNQ